jgi:WD40 repeat protein/energy-coupling factor transporter ATP-binding protein EcfA2
VNPPAQCPYLALRYFEERDSYLFYGRDEHVRELLSKLDNNRFVAVLGSSGCGKSSLVRAGLLPELKSGMIPSAGHRWKVIEFKPGNSPLQELGGAFEGGLGINHATEVIAEGPLGIAHAVDSARLEAGTNILIIADQFEEVFSYLREEQAAGHGSEARERAQALVRRLLDAAAEPNLRIYVLLVMRSDYLGDCAQFPDLPETMNASLYLVPRLRRDQLQRAIGAPVGGDIEPAVVQQLLGEAGTDPDQLPRLQHLLSRTWFAAEGGRITLAHCNAVGGWKSALEQHLDQIYESLTLPEQTACRLIFQRLSEIDGGRAVRRWATLEQLTALCGAEAGDVTARLHREGFLRLSGLRNDTVGVMHESVLRGWPRLVGWMEEENRAERRLRELLAAAHEAGWRPGLSESETKAVPGVSGLTLRNLVNWRNEFQPSSLWAGRYVDGGEFDSAMNFLDWCQEREAQRENSERAARLRARTVRLAAAFAVIVIAAIAVVVLKIGADGQRIAFQSYSANLIQVQRDFDSGDYAAGADLLQQTASLIRQPGWRNDTSADDHSFLVRSLSFMRRHIVLYSLLNGFDDKVNAGFEWGYLQGRSEGNAAFSYIGYRAEVRSVAISPDGKLVAAASADSTVRLFDISSFGPDSQSPPSVVRALLIVEPGHCRGIDHLVILSTVSKSINQQYLDFLKSCDYSTAQDAVSLQPGILSARFSPDGKWLAVTTGKWGSSGQNLGGTAYLWSIDSPGIVVSVHTHHWAAVDTVVFRPRTNDFATTSEDDTAEFFRIEPSGAVVSEREFSLARLCVGRPDCPDRGINAAAYSPDGNTFAMAFGDGHLWIDGRPKPVVVDASGLMSITFYDNNSFFVGTRDGRVIKCELSPDRSQRLRFGTFLDTGQGMVTSLNVSDDKNRSLLLTTGSTGTVLVWKLFKDQHDLHMLLGPGNSVMLRGQRGVVYSAAISRDLSLIVSGDAEANIGSSSGRVSFWLKQPVFGSPSPDSLLPGPFDAVTWESQPKFVAFDGAVQALAFPPRSPDCHQFAPEIATIGGVSRNAASVAPAEISFIPLDPASSKPDLTRIDSGLGHGVPGKAMAWSPDCRFVATSDSDGTVLLWDAIRHTATPLESPPFPVSALSFSPDGWLAGAGNLNNWDRSFIWKNRRYSGPGLVFLWHPADSQALQSIVAPPAAPNERRGAPAGMRLQALAFSSSGKSLALCGSDDTVQIWSVAGLLHEAPSSPRILNGTELPSVFPGSGRLQGLCYAVAFSPDGQWVAAGTSSREVAVWRTDDWTRVEGKCDKSSTIGTSSRMHCASAPPLASAGINVIAFSPDSQRLAYGTADSLIHVWDVTAETPLPDIAVHTGGVLSLAFSPDGRCIASGGVDNTLLFSCQLDPNYEQRLIDHVVRTGPDRPDAYDWISFAQ